MMRHKTFAATATKGAPGTNVFTISTKDVDRDGDRIMQNWNLEPYKHNSVVLFGHDRSRLPIGKCPDIRVVGGKLTGSIEWPPRGVYEFADTVHDLVDQGFLSAASVGFTCEDAHPNAFGGNDITAATLLEWSIVNLPSNPSATVQRSVDRVRLKSWLGGTWRDDSQDIVLRLIDHQQSPKEDAMRYGSNDVVLTLKDDDSPSPNMPIANWPEIRRRLAAAAREVDATCASLGIQSSIEQQVNHALTEAMNPTPKAMSPYLEAWLASQEKFKAEQAMQRLGREYAASMAVPESKRINPAALRFF